MKNIVDKQILGWAHMLDEAMEDKTASSVKESVEWDGAKEDIENELASKTDIPNYLKPYIKDTVLQDAGHDGVGYHDWDLDRFAEDLAEERKVVVSAIWNDGDNDAFNIEITGLPLKFSASDLDSKLAQMFPNRRDIFASGAEIEFAESGLKFYTETSDCFDDPEWRRNITDDGTWAIRMNQDGDADEVCIAGEIRHINSEFDVV